jgi:uncharacterized protein
MIRSATVHDSASLADLWRVAGLRFHPELTDRELAAPLAQGLVLVDEDPPGEITGTVFGSYDGMRGWIHRLATRPDRRRRGIGAALLTELERRLLALGCPKVNLLIEPDNTAVAGFYARFGYRPDELLFMEKWLVTEPGTASIGPNEPAQSPSGRPPASGGWRDIRPDLSGEQYVFAAAARVPAGLSPFAVIREDEGLTLILTRPEADLAGLSYDYTSARITLGVNSALADVGLTALVSRILADAAISCNVVAGLAHDHLFVAWDARDRALARLREL